LRGRSAAAKIVGVPPKLSQPTYSVTDMLAIFEDQVPHGYEEYSVRARHGFLWLEAGPKRDVLACRVAMSQSTVARLELGRRLTSLDSIGCFVASSRNDTVIVIEKKRLA
jgi:hypothetical protein